MVQFQGKKGIELSVNVIVMLVIGLTILGLVISFVTNFLGSAEEQFEGSLSDDDKTKLEQVEREDGNFAFLSGTVVVEKESSQRTKLYMKIRNPTSQDFTFGGGNLNGADSSDSLSVSFSAGAGLGGTIDTPPTVYVPQISLKDGEVGAFPLEVVAGETVIPGVYYAKFTANIGDSEDGETISEIVTIEVK